MGQERQAVTRQVLIQVGFERQGARSSSEILAHAFQLDTGGQTSYLKFRWLCRIFFCKCLWQVLLSLQERSIWYLMWHRPKQVTPICCYWYFGCCAPSFLLFLWDPAIDLGHFRAVCVYHRTTRVETPFRRAMIKITTEVKWDESNCKSCFSAGLFVQRHTASSCGASNRLDKSKKQSADICYVNSGDFFRTDSFCSNVNNK